MPSTDLHKNKRIWKIIFWLTGFYVVKKCGNVALRNVENTHHDPKYTYVRKAVSFTFRKMQEQSHFMHDTWKKTKIRRSFTVISGNFEGLVVLRC